MGLIDAYIVFDALCPDEGSITLSVILPAFRRVKERPVIQEVGKIVIIIIRSFAKQLSKRADFQTTKSTTAWTE